MASTLATEDITNIKMFRKKKVKALSYISPSVINTSLRNTQKSCTKNNSICSLGPSRLFDYRACDTPNQHPEMTMTGGISRQGFSSLGNLNYLCLTTG